MKRVSVFGATGSIGQNTLDLIRRTPHDYDVVALTGASNIAQLASDARALNAKCAVTADPAQYGALKDALAGTGIACAAGADALADAADMPADWTMSAIVGAAGLAPGLKALEQGQTVALANKESLVAAGPLWNATAAKHRTTVVPTDSEHSAIFQALIGEDRSAVERVIITASGGAFRDWPLEQLATATPEQAATHPNWDMGQRITIDSASLFNKAMELIETKEFFDFTPDQIEAVVHPESLIHAIVGFKDGGMMAHVGPPDMRHAISFALAFPNRMDVPVDRLDFAQIAQLTFRPADPERHPALALAHQVMEMGGHAGAAFNAAKEIALDRFIAKDIGFLDMARLVDAVLNQMTRDGTLHRDAMTLDTVLDVDHMARHHARRVAI
ncbi:MAG: 1-deoxy-D-xylulose-5-phosphate reductoisomerase [Pseudomonadota bacterium]